MSAGTGPLGEAFRIVQISDCHLSENPEKPYRGENADAGLESLLGVAAQWRPQMVIGTGDLSEDASPASYERLAGYFRRISSDILVLPGNHDDAEQMQGHFTRGPWQEPLITTAGEWSLVMLNSAIAGRIDGALSDAVIQRLHQHVSAHPTRPVLLALHHQPLRIGAPWIDRYMLDTPEEFLEFIESNEQVRAVVWGHVHQSFESSLGSASLLACPSTAANSEKATQKFVLDPAGPACRWLELYPQGDLKTGLFYASEADAVGADQ